MMILTYDEPSQNKFNDNAIEMKVSNTVSSYFWY